MREKGGDFVKRRIFTFLLSAILILTVSAGAISARAPHIQPGLSFTGDRANCSLNVLGDNSNENISATIKLMKGTTCLKTWSASDVGSLNFKETASAPRGATYTLMATVTIDGKTQSPISTSKMNR